MARRNPLPLNHGFIGHEHPGRAPSLLPGLYTNIQELSNSVKALVDVLHVTILHSLLIQFLHVAVFTFLCFSLLLLLLSTRLVWLLSLLFFIFGSLRSSTSSLFGFLGFGWGSIVRIGIIFCAIFRFRLGW